ncbi:MAG: hypothetical protein HZT40_02925 [Candidatus Thiothrix singaporensis]|uniref:Uncharacterized protein n=1 Tax=Candidatus Thiothrix singaporensis TaxID=2799669 RepID=A0A7L6ANR4_9GAMM|nr:MAG: hypothetical protein HZT40_02925 [Candidatus Thiothrix singaporensis]
MDGKAEDRIKTLLDELTRQCQQYGCDEFEYYWEEYGLWWYPWTIEVRGKSLSFSYYDIGLQDLDYWESTGEIKLIETCDDNGRW